MPRNYEGNYSIPALAFVVNVVGVDTKFEFKIATRDSFSKIENFFL